MQMWLHTLGLLVSAICIFIGLKKMRSSFDLLKKGKLVKAKLKTLEDTEINIGEDDIEKAVLPIYSFRIGTKRYLIEGDKVAERGRGKLPKHRYVIFRSEDHYSLYSINSLFFSSSIYLSLGAGLATFCAGYFIFIISRSHV